MNKVQYFFSTVTLLLFILSEAYAQSEIPLLPIDSGTGKITYSDIVYVDSLVKKQELFLRAREWFAKTYKSSTNVIQMEDKESGEIIGKALMKVYHKALGTYYPSGHINYTISIYLKEGKYRYEITHFYHTGQITSHGATIPDYGSCENMINTTDRTMGISHQKMYNYYLEQMDDKTKALIADLKVAMASGKKSDW